MTSNDTTTTTATGADEDAVQLSPEGAEALAALRSLPADEAEVVLAAYAAAPEADDEETDPLKLVANVRRG
ncbi:hypothetical protein JIG36_32125 [Actinoplanes sp. LDG1-06]|uniref:Uncharacterized protein n=1 Tax=Paractinoplanes ovalisporus TaxID=2810368 RepID=A0ABS2AJZ3_9ACTN|nr:hypothetical protein [Actinoplanes ovalisporus]MBM2620172.1 hypothetical protein [Actinoplanes ovalisporus]